MAESRVMDCIRTQEQMENDRSVLDGHYREIAERCLPRHDHFQRRDMQEGEKRTEKIFDSTALLALDRAASAIDSLITPTSQMYQKLDPEDDRLMEDRETRLYLDELNKMLFRMRYRPRANFAHQAHECYVSLMAFGTLGLYIDEVLGVGSQYKSISLAELYICEDHAGMIDMVHRKFPMQARQAYQKWGNNLPEKIIKAAEKEPLLKFDFLHCVRPNVEQKLRMKDYRGMPISSYYIAYEGQKMLDEGGYWTMPYAISRHVTAPKETYGRSPVMMVLPDIKMVNEMEKTTLRAAHKIVDPPLLLYGDGILSAFSTRPNALNFGGVDEQGRQLVHPMKTGSNLPIVLEMSEQKRKVINDALYVTLFQILVQNPQMTATEALIRAQEKGQLLAPTVGRQQSEFLGSCTVRELDMIARSGVLPPMPRKLRRSGGGVKAVYTSPLERLRRSDEGVAISRTFDFAAKMAEVTQDPSVFDNWDTDKMAREIGDIYGIPEKLKRDTKAIEKIRAGRQQAAEQQQRIAQAETLAKTAQHAAKAESLSPSQPEEQTV